MKKLLLGCLIAITLAACQTNRRDLAEPVSPPPASMVPFIPVEYTAQVRLGEGRYPDLISSASHAVWIAPEVRTLKIEAAQMAGDPVEPELMEAAQIIEDRYVVIECTVVSEFADMSIAYDVVGFRGVRPYMQTADGARIEPVQVEIGTPVREEPRGALKAFSRTNILVFPKFVPATGAATMPAGEPVRLVLEGFNSVFYFPWLPEPLMDAPPKKLSEDERVIMLKTKFRDVYGNLRQFGRKFD